MALLLSMWKTVEDSALSFLSWVILVFFFPRWLGIRPCISSKVRETHLDHLAFTMYLPMLTLGLIFIERKPEGAKQKSEARKMLALSNKVVSPAYFHWCPSACFYPQGPSRWSKYFQNTVCPLGINRSCLDLPWQELSEGEMNILEVHLAQFCGGMFSARVRGRSMEPVVLVDSWSSGPPRLQSIPRFWPQSYTWACTEEEMWSNFSTSHLLWQPPKRREQSIVVSTQLGKLYILHRGCLCPGWWIVVLQSIFNDIHPAYGEELESVI